ncbi:hypothetical protein Q5P01_021429 [Channa striata]|uniref:Rho GTPase activating protein 22 n=1 Tax=Channa striata TaxID=64152 RepID=A0AA88LU76_CHASR|nr:hypothetical protein Q5P01_021429 [Channa striata]
MLSPKIKQARRARSKSMVLGELSRVSRPCSPLDHEKALKAGWLKRQRSIMKNWQLRWFVLRTEALYFYKDQDETKAQGCIPLHGSQVNELPANQDEPGRHLFEIIPGGPGEKDRTGISHESYLLMANSQSDMEEWVRAIRRVIWAPLGGGVFGQHLEETMLYEAQCGPQRRVPVLVEQCVCFIHEHGLKEEGLFRAPGQTNHVRELQGAFDRGEKPVFDSTTDVHTVASLLKLYIRELPEPIIPFSKYTQFLSCAQLLTKNKEMGILDLSKQVKSLPQVNYNLLEYICKFLDEVQSHSSENKMSVQNLATVFGPNILRPRVEDPVTMMEGSSQVQHLMTVLISEHSLLYQRDQAETKTAISPHQPQSPVLRGKVEWLSQDDTGHTPSLKTPKEKPQLSTPSTDSKQTPPSPITISQKVEDGQIEEKAKSKTEEKSDGKIDSKTEEKSGPDVAGSPSKQSKALPTWRCSFKGSTASGGTRGKIGGSAGDVSAAGGSNWLMNGLSSLRAHRRTISSGERLKDSSLSLKDSTLSLKETTLSLKDSPRDSDEESSRISLPHRPFNPTHRMSAYDNVAPFQAGPGKKKLQMLEIRLRNSERAHQDAENRNVLLQKEMEEFFKTLGDLTTGATRTN